MSLFESLSVLLSIVIAFAMSEILTGWGRLIRSRDEVRPYRFVVLAFLLTPSLERPADRDLRASYFRNRRGFLAWGSGC